MKIDNRPLLAAVVGCAFATSPAHAQTTASASTPTSATSASSASSASKTAASGTTPYPASADGDGHVTNGYATARWAEDWRTSAARRDANDPLDRLKYLPLAADGDVYLTLGGELRLRSIYISNPGLVKGEHQRQDVMRLTGSADLHLGSHVRLFGELSHAQSSGHNIGTPSSSQDNDLVVEQSFVEVTGTLAGLDLGARYGRQMFYDGSKLMVSQRDNNAIHYTDNGLRLWARSKDVRVDLFDFAPTRYGREGTRDDDADKGTRFTGASLGFVVPKDTLGGSKLYVDPFFWRLRRRTASWVGTSGREERYYTGAHVWGSVGPVKIDWVADRQTGSFDGREIDAWQAFFNQDIALGDAKSAPRVGLAFAYASGGGGNEDGAGAGKLRDAISPHGANTPYSYNLFLTATNLVEVAPTFAFSAGKNVKFIAEYAFAWRANTQDAIYRSNGKALAGTQNSTAAKTAELPRLQVQWTITPRISVVGRYEHVFAGPALHEAGYGDSDYLTSWISLRF